jgi:hypothetical protein
MRTANRNRIPLAALCLLTCGAVASDFKGPSFPEYGRAATGTSHAAAFRRLMMEKEEMSPRVLETYVLPYLHPAVSTPVGEGLVLAVPPELANRELAEMGLVDVTAAPFQADPSGERDSTAVLQQAIDFAMSRQMALHFPAGRYRISDTLYAIQGFTPRSNGRIRPAHHHAPIWLGSSKVPGRRAEIFLAPNSPGFTDPDRPKIVIRFMKRVSPGVMTTRKPVGFHGGQAYNQTFRNIDIRFGEGNAGAIGIRMHAAEGSSIQDCTIYAEHGHTGVRGIAGGGGSHHNITVIGGRIGIDTRGFPPEFEPDAAGTQPTSTLTHLTLLGQTEAAMVQKSRGPVIGVGWRIVSPGPGPVIRNHRNGQSPLDSSFALIDSIVEFEKPAPANTLIAAERSFYFENVYVKNGVRVLASDQNALPPEWAQNRRRATAQEARRDEPVFNESPWSNGRRPADGIAEIGSAGPPADLRSRHIWPEDSPTWETPGAVNVRKPPYEAKGDSLQDDTAALQRAIDENEIVFLPKGYYRLTDTLRLKPNTKLLGVGHHLSILMARGPLGRPGAPAGPRPLIETADTADADTLISYVGFFVFNQFEAAAAGEGWLPIYALKWQCGGTSILRSPQMMRFDLFGAAFDTPKTHVNLKFKHPLALVTGHGGGKWYNFFTHTSMGEHASYRHLLVSNTTSAIAFYHLHAQHAGSEAQVEFTRAADVAVYGMKTENNTSFLRVRDCGRIRLYGYGGIATPSPGGAHMTFENVRELLLSNFNDQVNLARDTTHSGRHQRTYYLDFHPFILRDERGEIRIKATDRPIVTQWTRPESTGEDRKGKP